MKPNGIALKGHLKDKRFKTIMHQGLGKVAENLAKRLLISEGFDVRDFSFHVGSYIAGIHYARGMGDLETEVVGRTTRRPATFPGLDMGFQSQRLLSF